MEYELLISSSKLKRTSKRLTKDENCRNVLYIVGCSKSISSTELEKRLQTKYVYEIIKYLCPPKEEKLFLFEWNKEYFKKNLRNIVQRINSVFHVNFHISKKSDVLYDPKNENLKYETSNIGSNKKLIISDGSRKSVEISLEKNNSIAILATLENGKKGREKLLTVTKFGNKYRVYVGIVNFAYLTSKSYLDSSLKENAKQKITNLEKIFYDKKEIKEYSEKHKLNEYSVKEWIREEISNIERNTQNWRYSLNLRGLLLYLYLEYNLKRPNQHRIRKVISNPLLLQNMPFLCNWKFFEEKGFKVMRTVRKIANKLRPQLEIDSIYGCINGYKSNDYLLLKVTEEYFYYLYRHFEQVSPSRKKLMDQESRALLQKYYLHVLDYMKNQLDIQLKTVGQLHNFHSKYT